MCGEFCFAAGRKHTNRKVRYGSYRSLLGWPWKLGMIVSKLVYNLGGGNSNIFYVHPYLGKISNLTSLFFRWVFVKPPTSNLFTGRIQPTYIGVK